MAGYFCTACGNETSKWMGRCPGCGEWNTLAEQPLARTKSGRPVTRRAAAPVSLAEAAATTVERARIGLEGVDRVLGGGLVPGSLVLVAGEPGVGKSTLLLQVAAAVAAPQRQVLYVTAEESAAQVALRARRLGIDQPGLLLLAETSCEAALRLVEQDTPGLLVVDSVQTMACDEVDAVAGSVGQVRQVAACFQEVAKTRSLPTVLVGHVTKEGMIAGPKLLEHLVDVVLWLEGEPGHDLRVLRAGKNRYGNISELALFSMTERGLEGVRNPSAWLLEDRRPSAAGSAVAVAIEGTAPLLVEVQALVAASSLGTPRRVAQGIEAARLSLLLAVLERHAGVRFGDRDVYVNLAGGLALREPALDLAVAAALLSSAADRPLPADLALAGEVGLLGEVRAVSRAADRVREAAALGFGRVVLAARDAGGELALPALAVDRVAQLGDLLAKA